MTNTENTVAQAKLSLRKRLKAERKAFDLQEVQTSSCKVAELVAQTTFFQQADCLMAYLAFGKELSVDELIRKAWAAGKKICVPYICSDTEMVAVELQSFDKLTLDRYGIRSVAEPVKVVPPEELQLILVPGVAFSRKGERLGMGAGYYDRYLAKASGAIRCGIAYEKLLQAAIPTDQYDLPMDYVVAENSIFQISQEKSAK